MRKCSIRGCPGEYKRKRIAHTVRPGGKLVVISGVPAEVCSVCGDVLFSPKTVRGIESVLQRIERHRKPERTVPLFEYA